MPLNFVGLGPVFSVSASVAASAGMARIGEARAKSGNIHEMRIVRD